MLSVVESGPPLIGMAEERIAWLEHLNQIADCLFAFGSYSHLDGIGEFDGEDFHLRSLIIVRSKFTQFGK